VINLFDLFIYMFIFRIASLIVLSVVFRENSFMMMVVVVMMFWCQEQCSLEKTIVALKAEN